MQGEYHEACTRRKAPRAEEDEKALNKIDNTKPSLGRTNDAPIVQESFYAPPFTEDISSMFPPIYFSKVKVSILHLSFLFYEKIFRIENGGDIYIHIFIFRFFLL